MDRLQNCPLCQSETIIKKGADDRIYHECSNSNCRHHYSNMSRIPAGKKRYHYKLTKEDYIQIQRDQEEYSIGSLAKKWGVSLSQIQRILRLNLSAYAQKQYGEPPVDSSPFSIFRTLG